MPSIPDMIRSGKGEHSSAALLRDGVEATGLIMFAEDRLAAADRIDDLEAQVDTLKTIITDAIPFIGYSAHVPDLVERAEKAVDYAKEAKE